MSNFLKTYLTAVGIGGLLAAAGAKKSGPRTLFKVKKRQLRFPFYLRLLTSDVPACKQIFFDREYLFKVTREPEFIIDAGANIGLASVYFANRFPRARIIAIEPETGNYAILKKNVAPYANVVPLHAALWNENREIDLVDPGLGNWGFMTRGKESRGDGDPPRHRVMGVTVDDIIRDNGVERVDILKMDIEGAEREVLGQAETWLGKIDSMIIELHERMKPGCEKSFADCAVSFSHQWRRGENIYLARKDGCILPKPG